MVMKDSGKVVCMINTTVSDKKAVILSNHDGTRSKVLIFSTSFVFNSKTKHQKNKFIGLPFIFEENNASN